MVELLSLLFLPLPTKRSVLQMPAQSIGAGAGSLKERMALLQGKGAFGASGNPKPPPPPKPEKPYKWKIPSQDEDKPVVAPLDTPATEEGTTEQAQTVKHDSPQPAEAALEPEPEDDEESARRAALAARMAKLGGAKFGMGPPAFIRKDSALKSEDEDEAKNTPTPPTVEQPSEETISTEKPSLAEDYADASPSLLPPSDTTSIPVKPTVEELSASASPTAAQEENDLHVEPEELLDSPEVPVPPSVSEPRTTAPDQGECNSPASSPCFLSESTNPYDAVIGEDSTNPYDSMPLSTNPYDQPLSTSTNPYDPAPPPIVAEEKSKNQ
ncbi:hypothetical protein DL96DRAFT_675426 [Flagelloscypha sp. PMI_526]|nr:hypothetical protein DL96DRAFT_675426 [Flagelloscypha sp. PMI_526]